MPCFISSALVNLHSPGSAVRSDQPQRFAATASAAPAEIPRRHDGSGSRSAPSRRRRAEKDANVSNTARSSSVAPALRTMPGPFSRHFSSTAPAILPPPRLRAGGGRQLRHDEQHGSVKLFFLLGDASAAAGLLAPRIVRVVILEIPAQRPIRREHRPQLGRDLRAVLVGVRHSPVGDESAARLSGFSPPRRGERAGAASGGHDEPRQVAGRWCS